MIGLILKALLILVILSLAVIGAATLVVIAFTLQDDREINGNIPRTETTHQQCRK